MPQPSIGLLPVGLGGFNQAVDQGTDVCALWRITEQPVLASDDQRSDGAFGRIIDRQVTALGVSGVYRALTYI